MCDAIEQTGIGWWSLQECLCKGR